MDIVKVFGSNLKKYRTALGISQETFADKCGMHRTYISAIECYRRSISLENIQRIGIWGQRHLRYLKQHRKVLYTNLLTSGKLNNHLAEIDKQVEDMYFRLVKQFAESEGVTEELKIDNPMEWVGRMGNIQSRCREIVNSEVVFI